MATETGHASDTSEDSAGEDEHALEDTAALFRALGDPARLTILDELREADGICACDFHCCGLTQPTISHHLRVLREAGLVRTEKCGLWVRYSLSPERLADLRAYVVKHLRLSEEVAAPGCDRRSSSCHSGL